VGQRGDGELLLEPETERVTARSISTRDHAKADVFDYVERFYNARRRHSTIGYVSPVEYGSCGVKALGGVAERGKPNLLRTFGGWCHKALHHRTVFWEMWARPEPAQAAARFDSVTDLKRRCTLR